MKKILLIFNKFKPGSYLVLIAILLEIIERVIDCFAGNGDGIISYFGISFLITFAQVILLIVGIISFIAKNENSKPDKNNILLLIGALVFVLLVLEFLLPLIGVKSIDQLAREIPEASNFVLSDSAEGSYFVKSKLTWEDKEFFNNQGFRDKDEFVKSDVDTNTLKILLLGDSFTFGLEAVWDSADGYGDVLEKNLNNLRKTLLWNTGMIGIGQKQELHILKKYYPMLKPKYVILGFYNGNDWSDNLYPMGLYYMFEDLKCTSNTAFINRYQLLPDGSVKILSPKEAWVRAHPFYNKSSNKILGFLEKSKVISLVINAGRKLLIKSKESSQSLTVNFKKYHKFREPSPKDKDFFLVKPSPEEFNITLNLFKQISEYTELNNSKLIVLVIPRADEIKANNKGGHYIEIINICKMLNIDYVEVFDELKPEDSYIVHWNKKGHLKVGNILTDKIIKMLEVENINLTKTLTPN